MKLLIINRLLTLVFLKHSKPPISTDRSTLMLLCQMRYWGCQIHLIFRCTPTDNENKTLFCTSQFYVNMLLTMMVLEVQLDTIKVSKNIEIIIVYYRLLVCVGVFLKWWQCQKSCGNNSLKSQRLCDHSVIKRYYFGQFVISYQKVVL